MNIESEKSSETVSAPLWKYVTKLEKTSVGVGNVAFRCNYCEKTFKGSYSRVKAHLLKLFYVFSLMLNLLSFYGLYSKHFMCIIVLLWVLVYLFIVPI